jgi:hypothetical protein
MVNTSNFVHPDEQLENRLGKLVVGNISMDSASAYGSASKKRKGESFAHWSKNLKEAKRLDSIVKDSSFDVNMLPQEIYDKNPEFGKYGIDKFCTQFNKLRKAYGKPRPENPKGKYQLRLHCSCFICVVLSP